MCAWDHATVAQINDGNIIPSKIRVSILVLATDCLSNLGKFELISFLIFIFNYFVFCVL